MEPKRTRIFLGKASCEPYEYRRACPVYVDVEVKHGHIKRMIDGKWVDDPPFLEFSVYGEIRNCHSTDCYICGQCDEQIKGLDLLPKYRVIFDRVYPIWKKWHLKKWDNIPEEIQKEIMEILEIKD